METLDKMNKKTLDVYEKNIEKINKIKDEVKLTNDLCNIYKNKMIFPLIKLDDKLKIYFKKIDDIGRTIEGMESSVDYLDIIIDRIGNVFLIFVLI